MDIHNYSDQYVKRNRIIYTPSEFARDNLLYLQEIGELTVKKPQSAAHHDLASYLFIMVTKGKGYLYYINRQYEIEEGECAIINCQNKYYHMSSEKDPWTLKWIHFNGITAPGIYQKYVDRGGPIVFPAETSGNNAFDNKKPNEYIDLWQRVNDLANSIDYIRDMKINQELSLLWSYIMEMSINRDSRVEDSSRRSCFEIREYLNEHFRDKISLDDLSNRFYINKYYLSRLFKAEYGQTINDYLQNLRITHSKQLLRFSNLSIEEIGEESGIAPLYYFSRVFKQSEGINPSDYRKMWR